MDFRNEGDDYFQLAHYVPYHAYLEVVPGASLVAYLAAYLEPFRETYPEEGLGAFLVVYPDASWVFEPCEGMHDTRAQSYLNPVLPYYTPFRFQIVAEGGCIRYKGGGRSRGAAIRGEGTHDVTWTEGLSYRHFLEQMTESLG
jgi:hypothetical protein